MASSKTVTEILHNKNDLDQWTQPITDAFYHFCLGLDVTPRVDFLQKTIVLDGARVAVGYYLSTLISTDLEYFSII